MSLMSSLSNRMEAHWQWDWYRRTILNTEADHLLLSSSSDSTQHFISTMADDLHPPPSTNRITDLRAWLSYIMPAAGGSPSSAAAAAARNVSDEGEFSLPASSVCLSVVSPGGCRAD